MVPDTRSITELERYSILKEHEYRCQLCHKHLPSPSDAEIDHIQPYSKDGKTIESNLRPLCRPCNRRRSNSPPYTLRNWQREATIPTARELRLVDGAVNTAIVVAAPSSGKTRFACHMAQHLNANLVAISPSCATVDGWMSTAKDPFAIRLVDRPIIPPDARGVSMTYAKIAGSAERVADAMNALGRSTGRPTLVVLDEVHHLEDQSDSAWSLGVDQLIHGLDDAMVLSLSGTAWRTSGKPIAWVPYDEDGHVFPAYEHTVVSGIMAGDVRSVLFSKVEGETSFALGEDEHNFRLDGSKPDDAINSSAKRSMFEITGEVSEQMFRAGIQALNGKPEGAGGLVVCHSQEDAHKRADRLRALDQHVVLALSDIDSSAQRIKQFAKDHRKGWLVTCQMVSEGVDVPRLMVGLWFSTTETRLYFNQVVHRCTRTSWTGAKPLESSTWIIPNSGPWVEHAQGIESEVNEALKEIETRSLEGDRICSRCDEVMPCLCELTGPEFDFLGDDATGVSHLYRGESVDAMLVDHANRFGVPLTAIRDMAKAGLITDIDPYDASRIGVAVGSDVITHDETELRKQVDRIAKGKAGSLLRTMGGEYKSDFSKAIRITQSWANKRAGIIEADNRNAHEFATFEQLEAKSRHLSDASEWSDLLDYAKGKW